MKLETRVGAFFIGAVVVIGFLAMQMEKLQLGGNGGAREGFTVFDQVAGGFRLRVEGVQGDDSADGPRQGSGVFRGCLVLPGM